MTGEANLLVPNSFGIDLLVSYGDSFSASKLACVFLYFRSFSLTWGRHPVVNLPRTKSPTAQLQASHPNLYSKSLQHVGEMGLCTTPVDRGPPCFVVLAGLEEFRYIDDEISPRSELNSEPARRGSGGRGPPSGRFSHQQQQQQQAPSDPPAVSPALQAGPTRMEMQKVSVVSESFARGSENRSFSGPRGEDVPSKRNGDSFRDGGRRKESAGHSASVASVN